MNEMLSILLWPTLACFVLTGIHAYLGLHVIEREVIFVDLSLAQIAALGAAFGAWVGYEPHHEHSHGSYYFSLGFTLLGAGIFALTRMKKSKLPQEAIIGIVYVVCAAAAVMVMNQLPQGAEHFQNTLVGNLLAVTPQDVLKLAVLYAFMGIIHWFFRKPFLTISTQHRQTATHGYNLMLWDFLFYGTFGVIVTSSVEIAGVLLVFAFLIVPAATAVLFCQRIGSRLAFGWIMGVVVSVVGICASYQMDTPTGATVVCAFGLALVLAALIRAIWKPALA